MNTDDLLRLDDIAQKYFNVKPVIARRKAALNKLPIAAFRLTDSGKGPFFVRKETLETYVASRISSAEKQHRQLANA